MEKGGLRCCDCAARGWRILVCEQLKKGRRARIRGREEDGGKAARFPGEGRLRVGL